MVGFFIKKAFFDGWDNFMSLIVYNIGFMCVFGLFYLSIMGMGYSIALGVSLLVLTNFIASLYKGAVSYTTYEFAHYKNEGFSVFFKALKESFTHSILYFFTTSFIIVSFTIIIPFYFAYHNIIGYIVSVLVLWVALILAMANMYFFALGKTMMADNARKSLKKAFLIVSDNMGFSIFLGIYLIINFIISVLCAFLVPGITGITLAQQDAMMLLMYKYDYLETPDSDRKNIPWEVLLYNDKENIGHRTFKGMIFPWKD